jgi:hypothetical protein
MKAHCFLVLITSCTIAFAQTPHSIKPDFSATRGQLHAHIGNNDIPVGNSEEQGSGVEIHLRERKLRVLEEVVTNTCASAAGSK